MKKLKSSRARWIVVFALCAAVLSFGQGKKLKDGIEEEQDHPRERDAWFRRGRPSDGGRSAEKLHRAYQQKMAKRAARVRESQSRMGVSLAGTAAATASASQPSGASVPANGATWVPLGPAPEASDSSGSGSQDYGPVTGRATAVAVDQNDPSGGTVYVGGAYGGVWKSTNASDPTQGTCSSGVSCPPNVTWKPLIDNQATLAVGSIAIKPDDSNVVLVGTGESNSSGDSYYGLGVLRSADAGSTWTLITSAGSNSFRGLAFSRIAFATETVNSLSPNVVVASTAAASGGIIVGGEQTNTTRGLYYSTDAGQTWSYRDGVTDGGGLTPSAGSTHSVVYFPAQHKFYAALRAHGIYSSADGKNWTRLANQPGSIDLTKCPTTTSNQALTTCPLYRAELAVVPVSGRSEMYVWMVDANDNNQGIYQTRDGGNTWIQVNSSAIAAVGAEVDQGTYNLDLAAVPDGTGTDLYAGAVDQWKAILPDPTAPATWRPFVNLTHVYGCSPWGSYSHVHPDEHSIDFVHSNPQIIYFANDGGIYRTLNGYTSASGTCGTTPYLWDNLNSTMGSMTQYVWFSNHPSDPSTLLGGTQDNGSPATASAGTTQAWVSVNNGDGGYNTIDPSSPNTWYTSNTYASIQRCTSGINCTSGTFPMTVGTNALSGDYGAFYTPYMLDPENPAKVIVGTCRVWRGNADGSNWTASNALSYQNFSVTLANQGACAKGDATNPPFPPHNISALAAGGPKSSVSNSSQVIWAGTEQGRLYVTTNADGGPSTWVDVTGAGSDTINPKSYPISSIALDPSDPTGQTAYVAIMGFDVGHVWRTGNAGQSWTDYTGDLPNAPADAVVVDPAMPSTIFVGNDVGVFATTNGGVNWTEVGLDSNGANTFPNVAITRLAIFTGGATEHLRVSTYGRGVWDIDLGVSTSPTFAVSVQNPVATVNVDGQTTITGNLSSVNGYTSSITLSCSGVAPATCTPDKASYTLNSVTPFTMTIGNPTGGVFSFDILGTAADGTTHTYPVTVHVQDFSLSTPSVSGVAIPRGTTSAPVTLEIGSVGQFSGNVNATCAVDVAASGATCTVTPGAGQVSPTAALSESVTASTVSTTPAGTYTVTVTVTAPGLPTKTQTFSAVVQINPDYVLPSPPPDLGSIKATATASKTFSIGVQDGYSGTLALTCGLSTGGTCEVPASVTPPANVTLSVTPAVSASGAASATLNVTDNSNPPKVHSMALPYTASNYAVQSSGNATTLTGTSAALTFTVTSQGNYSGNLNTDCQVPALGVPCAMSPASPISIAAGGTTTVTASVTVPQNATPGAYNVQFTATDAAQSSLTHVVQATLGAMDFSMAATPTSASIKAGGAAPFQINVTPGANGTVSGTVNFSCSGLPQYSTCGFAPSSQTVGSSPASTQLTISTTAPSGAQTRPAYAFLLPIAGIAVVGIGIRRRRLTLMLLLVALCALAIFESCGDGSHKVTNPGTPAGTYTVTVSGSLGSAQRTTTVTLTVQ